MHWIALHWMPLLAVIGPIALATVISEFQDPDNDPKTPPPAWVRWLIVVQKILSLRAPAGTQGIVGQWSVPLLHYPKADDRMPMPEDKP